MNKDIARARNYFWRLLKQRLRSEREIREKLTYKNYDSRIIEEVVAYFKDLGYINDAEFARAWVNSRLHKPLALKAIAAELKQKGVSKEIMDEVLVEKGHAVNETAIIQELAQRHLDKLKRVKEHPMKISSKLYSYLLRRGFSDDQIVDVLSQLKII